MSRRTGRVLRALAAFAAWGCLAGCGQPSHEEEAAATESRPVDGPTTVHLDDEALGLADIELDSARMVPVGGLELTGMITFDQDRVSHVGPKTSGRVVELAARLGDEVVSGQTLAHLESPDVGALRAELDEAASLTAIARERLDRQRRLEEQGISSRREVLTTEAEFHEVVAARESAEERLRVLGASAHGDGGHFDIVSPYSGRVVQRQAGRGEVVGPDDRMFTVADLSLLWLELDAFEHQLSRVAEGSMADVRTPAWPDRVFVGRVAQVDDLLDPSRRSVTVRVEIDNADLRLKPGMFASAVLRPAAGDERRVLSIPRDAVQEVDGGASVWLSTGRPGEYVARRVEVGSELPGSRIEVISGLGSGELLVVRGAFTLKAESSRGDFGGHGH